MLRQTELLLSQSNGLLKMNRILPKGLTVFGVLVSISAVLFDPDTIPFIVTLVGEHAAAKIAAVGAIIAAFGKALLEKPVEEKEE